LILIYSLLIKILTIPDFVHKNVKIAFLPPNVTSLIQPMDQEVIANWKRYYRSAQLRELLKLAKDKPLIKCYSSIDMKFVLEEAAIAWDSVSTSVLKAAWKNLLGDTQEPAIEMPSESIESLRSLCNRIDGLQTIDNESISQWLKYDSVEKGFPTLSDQQILSLCNEGKTLSDCFDMMDAAVDSENQEIEIRDEYNPSIEESIQIIKSWADNLETADPLKLQDLRESLDYFSNFNKELQ
jgi:hypothetical protein